MMSAVISVTRMLCDSLAGYLLILSLTSGFALVRKLLAKLPAMEAQSASFKMHPNLPDLQQFHPLECAVLYVVSYPALVMYQAVPTSGIPGGISLALGLAGVLAGVIWPITMKLSDQNEKEKEVKGRGIIEESPSDGGERSEVRNETKVEEYAEGRNPTPIANNQFPQDLPTFFSGDDDLNAPPQTKGDPSYLVAEDSANEKVPLTTQTRQQHRGDHSCVVSAEEPALAKEMDNLIDSTLEPHYSNIIDTANAPIFGVDSEGRVNVWNKCAMRIVGYTPAEVMGKNLVKEFITKDYQASVGMVIERALRGDETANYEFPLMTKEGARIEILLNATARRSPNGQIIGVVGIGQDITGRIAQEREYTRLIDTANAPIFGVNTQCAVNIWNQSAIELVGYQTEEVMGKNLVKEFITDEFQTAVQAVLDQALQGEETANFEFPVLTKAGVRLEVLLNATTRRDEQGNIIGVVGIGQDITGRLAQEREYARLIDTANAPIFGVDTQGRVNVWNKCAMRLIGYSTEEVMGHSLVQEFITDDFKTAVQTVLDEALAGDETDNFEFPLITKGGARIEVLLNATNDWNWSDSELPPTDGQY